VTRSRATALADLCDRIVACRACPRLVRHRETTARMKRRAFAGEPYWGRPVPPFGAADARLLIVGLAPAAHGGNRTGRMFTGDRSGDFLYAALHRAGVASQAASTGRDDGLRLRDCRVTAVVRCAPPDNKPTPAERDRCLAYLIEELLALPPRAVVLCLGGFALDGVVRAFAAAGAPIPSPRPRFSHGAEHALGVGWPTLLCSYHPSQQNTFTGRLTAAMIDRVLARAAALLVD
jgi:uracil-DNA glycosylase family 4